jgi:signal transduction histidine kinase
MVEDKTSTIIPHNESERLKKLYEYQILDTHSEDTFDKIALVASQLFETPYAFISFVDEERIFFKANLSPLDVTHSRLYSPCAFAILEDDFTVIYDTLSDPCLCSSPLITGTDGIRFYAASPLRSPEGYLLGTLSVADTKPRTELIDHKKLEMLRSLSEVIVNKMESRLRYKNLLKSQNDLMNITLHEIKNPLASINLANDILKKDPTRIEKMSTMIKQSVVRIQSKLHDLLHVSEIEESQLQLNIEESGLSEMFSTLLSNFELQASRKRQSVVLEYDETIPPVFIDRKKISDVLHNLLSNAIKYSFYDSEIKIIASRLSDAVQIEFRDQGQGLEPGDNSKLFLKFAKLSARPTGKETSNGLGLSICKSLVEMHHGSIHATSKGKNKGSSFFVTLPIQYETEKEPEL